MAQRRLGQRTNKLGDPFASVIQRTDGFGYLNRRFGRAAVVPGSAGFTPKGEWSIKLDLRSPRYTTRVDEVPVVMAA